MKKIIIYLTNLTHIHNNTPSTETIPLNIGYLTAYAKKVYGDQTEIELFNTHRELNEFMKKRPPHILCGSNYAWNSNLSYHYLSYYKKKYPEIITVMGGPTFPYKPERRLNFLAKRKMLDFYISEEGEAAFTAFIQACLAHSMDIGRIKEEGVNGCHYLVHDKLVSCPPPDRIKHLDTIPSPYLEGFLDKFLERGFTPILQSNRGCPFSCAFCCNSLKYYNQVNFFSVDRIEGEIEYIAKRVKSPSIHIHDSNFGMFQHDYKICQKFKEVQEKFDWPLFISTATGKNAKENIIRCVELLGHSINFLVPVQSTNKEVLKNINRDNVRLDDFWTVQQRLREFGVSSHSEFILPLPGETFKSHLDGIRTVMSLGVDSIGPYTTMLLPSSPLYEEEKFDEFQMIKKYRVIPMDFGKYEGTNIVEVEKVCVGTRDLSFNDYLYLRGFHFIIYCYFNYETFKELFHYLKTIGLEAFDFCYGLLCCINTASNTIKMIFKKFLSDTRKELWNSEEDIYQYYKTDVNFNKLLIQEKGHNLLQKYKGCLFTGYINKFLEYGLTVATRLLTDMKIHYDDEVLQSIASYIINSRGRIFDIAEEEKVVELAYDVHTWRQEGFKKTILEYKNKVKLKFSQTEKQKNIIRDYVKIYGNTVAGKGKILTRISPKILFREISRVN